VRYAALALAAKWTGLFFIVAFTITMLVWDAGARRSLGLLKAPDLVRPAREEGAVADAPPSARLLEGDAEASEGEA
jgi:hypothetical protein